MPATEEIRQKRKARKYFRTKALVFLQKNFLLGSCPFLFAHRACLASSNSSSQPQSQLSSFVNSKICLPDSTRTARSVVTCLPDKLSTTRSTPQGVEARSDSPHQSAPEAPLDHGSHRSRGGMPHLDSLFAPEAAGHESSVGSGSRCTAKPLRARLRWLTGSPGHQA